MVSGRRAPVLIILLEYLTSPKVFANRCSFKKEEMYALPHFLIAFPIAFYFTKSAMPDATFFERVIENDCKRPSRASS